MVYGLFHAGSADGSPEKAQYTFLLDVPGVCANTTIANHKKGRPSRTHTITRMPASNQLSWKLAETPFGRLREQRDERIVFMPFTANSL